MSNSILPAAGNLDIVNANVRADKFNAATNIGVANTNPDFNFSVANKFHVNKDSVDPVSVTGNVVASGIKISNLTIGPAFDFASVSNVGNVTANVIQFANATTGFTTTANVEIGGNIGFTSNAQVKVDSNTVAEYTGPHLREPNDAPLKKYPEINFDKRKMDKYTAANTYTQAGYTVTASSSHFEDDGFAPWKLFNGNNGLEVNNGWHGSDPSSVSGAPYNAIDTNYIGEWIKLELPTAINLSHVSIAPRISYESTHSPAKYRVYGSNNDSTWVQLIDADNVDYNSTKFTTRFSTTTDYYKYLALVIQRTTAPEGNFSCAFSEIQYYGRDEPTTAGDLSLDTTLKSAFNSVRTNDYVMYFDGKDPDTGNVPKNLVNGSSLTITPHNAVFDTTNNCWSLDGSTESNVTTADLGFEGDAPHTVSMWINASNLNANTSTQQLFTIGSGYDKSFVRVDNTEISTNTWHNVTYAYQGEDGSKVTYIDGRKVKEEQAEDTTEAYPPFPMTDYETDGFRVSASSIYGHDQDAYPPWEAFDETNPDDGNGWLSQNSTDYNNGTGLYEGTIRLSPTTDLGEWIKLELPFRIYMQFVEVGGTSNGTVLPRSYKVYGSNDDENWYEVLSRTDRPLPSASAHRSEKRITADDISKAYKYFAFVVTKTRTDHPWYIQIREMKYFGHKEGDLTRFPEPTRVLKYPHVSIPSSYTKRGYVVSASSDQYVYGANNIEARGAWAAFGNTGSEPGWQLYYASGQEPYDSTADGSGFYQNNNLAPTLAGTSHRGHWIKLELPHKLMVQKMKTDHGSEPERLGQVILLGSNNDSDWYTIKDTFALTSASAQTTDINATVAYKYIVLIVKSLQNASINVDLKNLEYYGTQEDIGTPAIVGGPFAGKVANFRVYDKYLGEERIQEIYDAQKDAFGHKKSSMTLYKGRIGVGTTEPEGALTVLDEPHALEKFPARNITANDAYVEEDGQIKITASREVAGSRIGSQYKAFDGLTSTSWVAKPERKTRLSEEVDLGAWLKIQTPESMSLKKAEIESNPYWDQVGSDINGSQAQTFLGISVDCSHDGTRIVTGSYQTSASPVGEVRVYDWNGSAWTQIGNTITGPQSSPTQGYFGREVAISGNGQIIAVSGDLEDPDGNTDRGVVRVLYLNGGTWTVLADSGSETVNIGTGTAAFRNDVFVGSANSDQLGRVINLSYDGKTILMTALNYDDSTNGTDAGQARVYTYSNGAWSKKGDFLVGGLNEHLGYSADMSDDGNCIILGGHNGTDDNAWIYIWNGSTWVNRGASGTNPAFTRTDQDAFGQSVAINNDGTVVAFGLVNGDVDDGALSVNGGIIQVYHWSGTAWVLKGTLNNKDTTDDEFGSSVHLSGDGKRLIAGAKDDSTTSANNGRLYTYEYDGSNWFRRTPYIHIGVSSSVGDDTEIANSNRVVGFSRDGSIIVSGEFGFNSTNGGDSGRVRVFSMPSNIKGIWGSNDDKNWTKITTAPTREEATSNVAGVAFRYTDRLEFKNLDNPNYYKYHAIVADAFTRLKDVKLFGVRKQGSSTLHDGALTLTKNLNVPRIGAPPDADDTPRRDRLVIELDTTKNIVENGLLKDTSGRENHGKLFGDVTYNIREKALLFAGQSTDYASIRTGFEGDQSFTLSFWFKFNAITSGRKDLFSILGTTGVSGSEAGLALFTPGTYLYTHNNDIYNTTYDLITDTNMHHIVVTYSGGVPSTSTLSLYLDNLNVVGNLTTTNATVAVDFIKDKSFLRLSSTGGGGSPFNGSISNLKLYDVALTEREIETLYQMGRCNEGHHTTEFSKGRINFEPDTLTISKIPVQPKMWADGGEITEVDGFRIHTFFSSGTFHLYTGGYVEYLVIGGGGGGGGAHGGGGGAGGFLQHSQLLGRGTYAITVGAGGAGGTGYNSGGYGTSSKIHELRDQPQIAGVTIYVAEVGGGGAGGHGYGPMGSANTSSENGGGGASAGGSGPYGNAIAAYDYDDDSALALYVTPNPGPPYIRRRAAGYINRYQGNNSGSAGPVGGAGHGGGGGGAGGRGINAIAGSAGYNDGVSGGGGPGVYTRIRGFSELLAGGGAGGRWGYSSAGPFSNGLGYNEGGGGSGGPAAGNGGGGTTGSGGGGGGGGDGGGNGGAGGSGRVVIRYAL